MATVFEASQTPAFEAARGQDGLRKAPAESLIYNPSWTPARKKLFGQWVDVTDGIPEQNEVIARVLDRLWDGDSLMDEVALMFKRLPSGQGRKLFEQALENGIETLDNPPEELIVLFKQLDRIPEWLDWERFNNGALVAANITAAGKASGMFLNTLLTIQGGLVGAAVGATGRMQRDALQRARESAEFWRHLPAPGAMERFGIAFKTTVRVRLMHSQARLMLLKKWGQEWYQLHGNPIPNSGLVAGIPTFGIANMMWDMYYGKKYSRQNMEDIHLFWSYIGYVLGADEDILPKTPEEGISILDFVLSVTPPPSQYSEQLNEISNLLLDTMMNAKTIPLLDKQIKPYIHQALNGFYFFIGGDYLGQRITGTKAPTLVGRTVPKLVAAMVKLSNLFDYIPGKKSRWEKNRLEGDPFWIMLSEQFDGLALEQNDHRKAKFNSHDQSKVEDIGEPWKESTNINR